MFFNGDAFTRSGSKNKSVIDCANDKSPCGGTVPFPALEMGQNVLYLCTNRQVYKKTIINNSQNHLAKKQPY